MGKILKEGLPDDCQSKEDGVCFLPIGSCKQCVKHGTEVMPSCICNACNKAYTYDLIVPDELWAVIAPKKMDGWKSGGLLCPECILRRTIQFYKFDKLT